MDYITDTFFTFVAFIENMTPAGLFAMFAMFIGCTWLLDLVFGGPDAQDGAQ